MFVILQCMSNIEEGHGKKIRTVKEKIALTMQHAGVAITVTSVTDVMAFGVGACTVSLRFHQDGGELVIIQNYGLLSVE